jgi:predicted hydrolase (HD superfamily)
MNSMSKEEALNVWQEYSKCAAEAFHALDKVNACMRTDRFRKMCDVFGEDEEDYTHRKDFRDFLNDLPDAMGY